MKTGDRSVTEKILKRPAVSIAEIILENFMSYEYAKIPLKPGLNIICGPNGAGKSSVLLAIAVALGQVYTERSRKLSDLIRRGKEIGRVSLLFDNSPRDGKRPIPSCRSDRFLLSRYLRSDGSYWYEADFHVMDKHEVTRLFRQFGINPDNLLIIMHQGMVEKFSITSPQEKLKMVEEAVGFQEYRERVLDAQEKLTGLLSEESSLGKLVDHAGETLSYWKNLYDRFLLKKNLLEKKGILERELAWSNVLRVEKSIEGLRGRLEARKRASAHTAERINKAKVAISENTNALKSKQIELRKLYFSHSRLERDLSKAVARGELFAEFLTQIDKIINSLNSIPFDSGDIAGKNVKDSVENIRYARERYSAGIEESKRKQRDAEMEVQAIQGELGGREEDLSKLIEKYAQLRASEALLEHHGTNLEREISNIERSISEAQQTLGTLLTEAEAIGPRMETSRVSVEVSDDIKVVQGHLQSLDGVPDDAEKIYLSYASNYDEIKQRLQTVLENKSRVLIELESRNKVWRDMLHSLIDEVNPPYQNILQQIGADGLIRLINAEDIEGAGLELLVGFRGSKPVVLDAYTQSGGERSVSVMAFLLSLQDRVISPFRAIDEFEMHMDPRNRELVFKMIFSHIRGSNAQNLVITPSQLTVIEEDVNLIFVQNTSGKSEAGRGQVK